MKRDHGKIHKLPEDRRMNYVARIWDRSGKGKAWRDRRESYTENHLTELSFVVSDPRFTALRPGSLKEILEGCNCCVYFEVPNPTKEGFTIEIREVSRDRKRIESVTRKHYIDAAHHSRIRFGQPLTAIVYEKDQEKYKALNALEEGLASKPARVPVVGLVPIPELHYG